jgi:hypothetical protein
MSNVTRARRQVRLSRALGLALTPKAVKHFEKRPYPPGEHGRARRRTESDYAVRLREKQRLRAQYARVGATTSIMEIQGATSVVETLDGAPNAYEIARTLVRQGYRGCWVIALGTNDTADVYVGSSVSLAARIQRMMSVIGNQPVLWVNVVSETTSGPYSEANMRLWNQALLAACPRYPNMRVLNWAALAQPGWFIADGLHYNSIGSAARAAAFANGLAEAFPAPSSSGSAGRGGPAGCEVL